jgi:hypothetical protein
MRCRELSSRCVRSAAFVARPDAPMHESRSRGRSHALVDSRSPGQRRRACQSSDAMSSVATRCGLCSYQWVLVPAVSRSFFCPRCGGDGGLQAAENVCACGHRYGDHRTASKVPPSRSAAETQAELGKCKSCVCDGYRYKVLRMPAEECLGLVSRNVNRGAQGRDISVERLSGSTVRFSLGNTSLLAATPDKQTINILTPQEVGSECASFAMGDASVADIVIWIIGRLT